MNFLASQYGKEALRAAYKAWEANESAEALWPQMAQMAIAQPQPQQPLPQALLMPPAPPAPVAAEPVAAEQPVVPVAEPVRQRSYNLVSDDEILRITEQINNGHLRSPIPTVSWNPTAKHYPGSARPSEIIAFLQSCEGRSATKEVLLREMNGWAWDNSVANGGLYLSHYMRELEKQGIVRRV
jgi:hypothetical protein